MIPSSPRRTWVFLLLSSLAFFGPGLLAPVAWEKQATYLLLSNLYQGMLVVAGFWYGPAICKALVVRALVTGSLRQGVDRSLAELHERKVPVRLAEIPITLVEHATPFIVTAGLLPGQSQVFLSSGLVEHLGINGLRFLLARALVHSSLSQRLAALLPVLVFAVMFTDIPSDVMAWFRLAGFLGGWLVVHWFFELRVDRQAAQAMGPGATEGLREMLAANDTHIPWLSVHPPTRWRLRMVGGE